jgi:hypothetical protein
MPPRKPGKRPKERGVRPKLDTAKCPKCGGLNGNHSLRCPVLNLPPKKR